ncbi:MAG: hypothetical protein JRD94_02490 [Deltaproteobacteria bacterium]|nr:hypothetical protein [Deltaproteobacteria bacterium]
MLDPVALFGLVLFAGGGLRAGGDLGGHRPGDTGGSRIGSRARLSTTRVRVRVDPELKPCRVVGLALQIELVKTVDPKLEREHRAVDDVPAIRHVATLLAQRNRRMEMPERLSVTLREVALHRQQLTALEPVRLFVAPLALMVFGQLDPFESAKRADPRRSKSMLADEIAKRFLHSGSTKDASHDVPRRARLDG